MSDNIPIETTEAITNNSMQYTDIAANIINSVYLKKKKRDIWMNSKWKHIAELGCDEVGKTGELIISEWCKTCNIESMVDGQQTKKIGGGNGDGTIKKKDIEIKTARLGTTNEIFQHELGEKPWNPKYMIFLDIAPEIMYITIFPNFSQDFYQSSGRDSHIKCKPYFPTKSITWRKQSGAFKLDTSININKNNKYTISINPTSKDDIDTFRNFVNASIP